MHTSVFVGPSCEALANGSAHPGSHLSDARRLKEGDSVYLSSHISEETHYPLKAAAARKTDTSEMGDVRLQGSRPESLGWIQ